MTQSGIEPANFQLISEEMRWMKGTRNRVVPLMLAVLNLQALPLWR